MSSSSHWAQPPSHALLLEFELTIVTLLEGPSYSSSKSPVSPSAFPPFSSMVALFYAISSSFAYCVSLLDSISDAISSIASVYS